ncbi:MULTISPECIES: Na+/H+ antiporter subunit E [unclassified Legionella]|uniref:Na+/H+ antiporter subunit E n=1 Tax=unclassified Legionella TaxID=2622702 RepID=UPI0010547105|nr:MULTISPECIES: Na+/H+ antiporter subunit E [unclassified Legionella]MDI9819421.1 Na+/H+ antiporter subunit E [Legionella sp. PL877]
MPAIIKFLHRLLVFMLFSVFVLYEIIIANLRVAYVVLTPRMRAKPALVYFPLDCTNDIQITLLANVISLTPGTLALEITDDKKTMLMHVMFFSDKQRLIDRLKRKFEQPIMEIWP